ncbi:hypothetical protein RJT34_24105 [Clitoria ternatea]|uniref:Uncharacterized protein n=1 Tax=Clitoria ternatea TaxID=43366 RepID=A0AAN9FQ54_CLITE
MERDANSSSLEKKGISCVPQQYVIPTLHRPNEYANVAVIDVAALNHASPNRSRLVQQIRDACRRLGFFQIVNHGVSGSVLDGALSVASKFFDMPTNERMKLKSNDVHKPVRYGTSLKDGIDEVKFWRVFLKHYAYPLKDWIHMWPQNPHDYREKMGRYCQEVKKLGSELMTAVIESLELDPTHLTQKIEDGMQVMAVNCYPPCPEPEVALGLPPHSDYSCLTILHQSCPGLEIMDLEDGRATLSRDRTRISITSLFSLGMDDKMECAQELVNDQYPKKYRESSFRDFLNFLASNDIAEGKNFIDMLKIKDN